jgi:hypothetical protein
LWILFLLLAVILLLFLFLCLPLDFVFVIDTATPTKFKSKFIWLFGLVQFDLKHKDAARKVPAGKDQQEPKTRKSPGLNTIIKMLKTPGLCRQIWVCIKDLFRLINIKELFADFHIGMEDPLDSSLLFASAMPLNFLLSLTRYRLNIIPIFTGDLYLKLQSRGQISIYPLQVIACVTRLIFSAPVIRVGWQLARGKWKDRK